MFLTRAASLTKLFAKFNNNIMSMKSFVLRLSVAAALTVSVLTSAAAEAKVDLSKLPPVSDKKGVTYIDCSNVELPYGRQLIADVKNRTETAMSQAHCFKAMELALRAQELAERGTVWQQ